MKIRGLHGAVLSGLMQSELRFDIKLKGADLNTARARTPNKDLTLYILGSHMMGLFSTIPRRQEGKECWPFRRGA
jgi:hypothetical protein